MTKSTQRLHAGHAHLARACARFAARENLTCAVPLCVVRRRDDVSPSSYDTPLRSATREFHMMMSLPACGMGQVTDGTAREQALARTLCRSIACSVLLRHSLPFGSSLAKRSERCTD